MGFFGDFYNRATSFLGNVYDKASDVASRFTDAYASAKKKAESVPFISDILKQGEDALKERGINYIKKNFQKDAVIPLRQ